MSGLLALLLVAAAASLRSLATAPALVSWYGGLEMPAFSPPIAVFRPVWAALYLLMAFAFWRVLSLSPRVPGRRLAIVLFLAQLALNAFWSFLFLDAHSPLMGLIDIVPQWLLIVATIAAFWPLDRSAALALVPLAAWVGFASLLNFEVWRLN